MPKNKVFASFAEAVRDIPDGSVIGFGGFAVVGMPINLYGALAEQGATVPLELVPPTTRQQEQHILQLEPWFQRGHIYVGKGQAFQEFRTQYSQFPRAARFDLLRALAYAPSVWKKQPGGAQLTTEERRAQELSAYRARRGLRV